MLSLDLFAFARGSFRVLEIFELVQAGLIKDNQGCPTVSDMIDTIFQKERSAYIFYPEAFVQSYRESSEKKFESRNTPSSDDLE